MNRRFTEDELKIITVEGLPFVGQWLMSGMGALKDTFIHRGTEKDLARELEKIRQIVRLRFLLAQSRKLCDLFKQIELRASTHRVMKRESVAGFIKGRLDVSAYINHRHERRVPKEYPCIVVDKELDTPENVLLCMTLIEFMRDLKRTSEAVSKHWGGSLKPREVNLSEQQLKVIQHLISSVVWAKPTKAARRVIQNQGFYPTSLLRNAQVRLAKKRMRNPELYREFLSWLSKYTGSWAPGLIDINSMATMLSYDSTAWHDRLFELYGTWKLAEHLAATIGSDPLSHQINALGKHKQGPVFSFEFLQPDDQVLDIRLYFQKAGGILWDKNTPPQIYYSNADPEEDTITTESDEDEEVIDVEQDSSGKTVKGIPDAIFECQYQGNVVYLIVDFKNRFQMSQEHLVMAGYYHNFKNKMKSPYGCLIFRTRTARKSTRLVINPGHLGVCYAGPSKDLDISDTPYRSVIGLLREACQRELGAALPG